MRQVPIQIHNQVAAYLKVPPDFGRLKIKRSLFGQKHDSMEYCYFYVEATGAPPF